MVVKDPSSSSSQHSAQSIMEGLESTGGVRLHGHKRKLRQRFDIVKKLGQGTYGKVQLGINKETGQEVAIKTIKKAKIETEADLIRIRREIQIMSSVRHPHIIHIYEVFENREKMVLVMEYANGGELYDFLSDKKVLVELEARRIFRQIACAVYYCHKHKICHRDLKLENILLDDVGNAKIADFGLSNVFDQHRLLTTFCGSPLYASPEIVRGTPYQGPEVDCWSLGVLLYTLVYGAMPFDGSNFKRLVKQISQGDYYEPKKVSPASPLIHHMLTVNPAKRANIEDICSHWWVNEGYSESCLEIAEHLANQTPVRLDLLLSLAPQPTAGSDQVVVPKEEDLKQPPVLTAETRDIMNQYLSNNAVPALRCQSEGSLLDIDQSDMKKAKSKEEEKVDKRKLEDGVSESVLPKQKDVVKVAANDKDAQKVIAKKSPLKSKSSPGFEPMDVDESSFRERTVLPSDTLCGVSELATEEVPVQMPIPTQEPATPAPAAAPSQPDQVPEEQKPQQEQQQQPTKDTETPEAPKKVKKIVKKKKVVSETSPKPEPAPAEPIKEPEKVEEPPAEKPVENKPKEKTPEKHRGSATSSDIAPAASKLSERRLSNIAKTAEIFKNLSAKSIEPSKPAEKPRKVVLPNLKISDIKKTLESPKAVDKKVVLPGVKVSDAKRAFEQKKSPESPSKADIPSRMILQCSSSTNSTASAMARRNSYRETPRASTEEDSNSNKDSNCSTRRNSEEAPDIVENPAAKPPIDKRRVSDAAKPPRPTEVVNKAPEEEKTPAMLPPLTQAPQQEEARVRVLKEKPNKEDQKFRVVGVDNGEGGVKNVSMLVDGPTTPPSTPTAKTSPKQVEAPPTVVRKSGDAAAMAGTENSYMKNVAAIANKQGKQSKSPQTVPTDTVSEPIEAPRKKTTTMEIVLSNPNLSKAATLPRRAAASRLNVPTVNGEVGEYKTEIEHTVGSHSPSANTQRTEVSFPVAAAPPPKRLTNIRAVSVDREQPKPLNTTGSKERIIPINMEDNTPRNVRSQSVAPSHTQHPMPSPSNDVNATPKTLSRQSTQDSDTESATISSSLRPEPIRKSPREYIIPILVEGGGCVTPKEDVIAASSDDVFRTDSRLRSGRFGRGKTMSLFGEGGNNDDETSSVASSYQTFQRHQSVGRDDGESVDDDASTTTTQTSANKLRSSRSNNRQYSLEHSDSFSSAEDDDDDDGFQILTAESLFSTLLARVRSLTRRLNHEDPTSILPRSLAASRRYSRQASTHSQDSSTPGTPVGFWSTSYTGRDSDPPSRRVSDASHFSRSVSRDESSIPWRRTLSRESSDGDGYYTANGLVTLPRGTYSSRSECGAESDASSDTSSSYPMYTPSLSRRLSQPSSRYSSSSRVRNIDNDVSSTRSDPDGVGYSNRLTNWRTSSSSTADTLPTPRRRAEYGRTLSSYELGAREREERREMAELGLLGLAAKYYPGRKSSDYLNTSSAPSYATLRHHQTTPWTRNRRPYSVLDSTRRPDGWVDDTSSADGQWLGTRATSEEPANNAAYETSFLSQPAASDRTGSIGNLIQEVLAGINEPESVPTVTVRLPRAASVGRQVENVDGTSSLPRLRDLQYKSLTEIKKDKPPPPQPSSSSPPVPDTLPQQPTIPRAVEPRAKSVGPPSKPQDKKEVDSSRKLSSIALKPAMIIKRKLTPLVEATKQKTKPEEPVPEDKRNGKPAKPSAVSYLMNKFRKADEAAKPPVMPRARRTQSVYAGAVSDGVIEFADGEQNINSDLIKSLADKMGDIYKNNSDVAVNLLDEATKVAREKENALSEPKVEKKVKRDKNPKGGKGDESPNKARKRMESEEPVPKPRKEKNIDPDIPADLVAIGEAARRRRHKSVGVDSERLRAVSSQEPVRSIKEENSSQGSQVKPEVLVNPPESPEEATLCSENLERLAAADDEESVSERIRRKSFFSRFNNETVSRRKSSKSRRPSKETMLDSRSKLHLDILTDAALLAGGRSPGSSTRASSCDPSSPMSSETKSVTTPTNRVHDREEDDPFHQINMLRKVALLATRPTRDIRGSSLPRLLPDERRRKVGGLPPFDAALLEHQEVSSNNINQNGSQNGDDEQADDLPDGITSTYPRQCRSYSSRRQSSSRLGALLSELQKGDEGYDGLNENAPLSPPRRNSIDDDSATPAGLLGRKPNRYSMYNSSNYDPSNLNYGSGSSYGRPASTYSTYGTLPRTTPSSSLLDNRRAWRSSSVAGDNVLPGGRSFLHRS